MKNRKVKQTTLHELWDYVKMIVIVVVLVLLVNNFIVINAKIPSESMENTIMTGDQILGNRLTYRFHDPERYDIVIFKYPDNEKDLFIKRVIGLPGETVTVKDGKVYINDETTPLRDDFLPEPMEGDFGPYEVPQGAYFVMGDNRNYSSDARFWKNKYVYKDKILGKAMLRYYPFNKIGLVK